MKKKDLVNFELKQELYDVYDKDQNISSILDLTWKKKKVQLMVFQELNGLMIIRIEPKGELIKKILQY
jgi:hypothetical protein